MRAIIFATLLAMSLAKPQPLPPMTAEQWRADIEYFGRELPRRHKNAFHAITREQFTTEVARLGAKANGTNDDEMIVGLMLITAMVGDGHTYLHLPSNARFFPVTLADIEGAQRIVRGAGAAADLVGGKLIRIDDTPIDKAIALIRTILPQDESEVLLAAYSPQWLSYAAVLHGLGITKSSATARFTALMDDGSERSAEVSSFDLGTTPDWRTATANPPLYRQKLGESFWFTWLPESATVYVNFRKYDDLRAKSRELWQFVDSHPATKIVIDLRQNGGGDFNVGRKYLVDELARRPKLRGFVATRESRWHSSMGNGSPAAIQCWIGF